VFIFGTGFGEKRTPDFLISEENREKRSSSNFFI